jgi:hypothetical protein
MGDLKNNQIRERGQILPKFSLVAYALGVVFLFSALPKKFFLSPGLALPTTGATSPFFFSMILLAITSIVFIIVVLKKEKELKDANKISSETKKFIEKNIEEDVEKISESVLVRKDQAKRDFNRFIYVIGLLSIVLASIQAWKIFFIGAATGISIIYWGAYLAIAAAWFGYGMYYKDRAVMITYGIWIFLEITIINGTIFYS